MLPLVDARRPEQRHRETIWRIHADGASRRVGESQTGLQNGVMGPCMCQTHPGAERIVVHDTQHLATPCPDELDVPCCFDLGLDQVTRNPQRQQDPAQRVTEFDRKSLFRGARITGSKDRSLWQSTSRVDPMLSRFAYQSPSTPVDAVSGSVAVSLNLRRTRCVQRKLVIRRTQHRTSRLCNFVQHFPSLFSGSSVVTAPDLQFRTCTFPASLP